MKPLEESNGHLEDKRYLSKTLREKGYLFFRGILDKKQLETVRRDIFEVLSRTGYVKKGAKESIWSGTLPGKEDALSAIFQTSSLSSVNDLAHSSRIVSIMEKVTGKTVFVFEENIGNFLLPSAS